MVLLTSSELLHLTESSDQSHLTTRRTSLTHPRKARRLLQFLSLMAPKLPSMELVSCMQVLVSRNHHSCPLLIAPVARATRPTQILLLNLTPLDQFSGQMHKSLIGMNSCLITHPVLFPPNKTTCLVIFHLYTHTPVHLHLLVHACSVCKPN